MLKRRALWRAIQEAAGNERGSGYVSRIHPINGLRAIRDFERINGVAFDPRNRAHRAHVHHMGRHRAALSALRQIFAALAFNRRETA